MILLKRIFSYLLDAIWALIILVCAWLVIQIFTVTTFRIPCDSMKQITGKESPIAKMLKTTAEAVNPKIDLGIFPKTEMKTAVFEIKNTGTSPRIIVDVSTTCSCTAAMYDKKNPRNPERFFGWK